MRIESTIGNLPRPAVPMMTAQRTRKPTKEEKGDLASEWIEQGDLVDLLDPDTGESYILRKKGKKPLGDVNSVENWLDSYPGAVLRRVPKEDVGAGGGIATSPPKPPPKGETVPARKGLKKLNTLMADAIPEKPPTVPKRVAFPRRDFAVELGKLYPVFPVDPRTKEPRSDPTQDPGEIDRQWALHPTAQIGVVDTEIGDWLIVSEDGGGNPVWPLDESGRILRKPREETEPEPEEEPEPIEEDPIPDPETSPLVRGVKRLHLGNREELFHLKRLAYIDFVMEACDLPIRHKLTLICLSRFGAQIYPSHRTLAKRLGLGLSARKRKRKGKGSAYTPGCRQVRRILKDLNERGFVDWDVGGGKGKRGPLANRYKLFVPGGIFCKGTKGHWELRRK